jgi:hypothetical protein
MPALAGRLALRSAGRGTAVPLSGRSCAPALTLSNLVRAESSCRFEFHVKPGMAAALWGIREDSPFRGDRLSTFAELSRATSLAVARQATFVFCK